jgi:hypothetical protein
MVGVEGGRSGRRRDAAWPLASALAFVGYLALAVAITWPLALHPKSSTFGYVPSDLSSHIARYQEFVADRQPPFLPGRLHGVDAPDGYATTWTLDLASFPSSAVYWVFSLLLGGIGANGLLAIGSFALSAFSMFLLTRWITGDARAAFVAGLAFGFWPWVFSTATQPYGHGWVFVLPVWRALVLWERPNSRNGLLFGLSVVLSMLWLQYWVYLGGVLFVTLGAVLIAAAAFRRRAREYARPLLASMAPVAVVLVFLGIVASVASPGEIPVRSRSESYVYSARPLMYVVPHPENFVFGEWTEPFLQGRYRGGPLVPGETAYADIYVGLTVVALAAIGVAVLWLRLRRGRTRALSERSVIGGLAGVAIITVGFLLSMPPSADVGGVEIPLPGAFVNEFTAVFRTTHRFAVLVMLGLCICAAVGVRAALSRLGPRPALAVLAALAIVVPLDLWGRQHDGSSRVNYPEVYEALRSAPRGIVAVYPFSPADADQGVVFDRPAHGMPLFNGARVGTESATAKSDLAALSDPGNAARLAALGVRYVVVKGGAKDAWQPRPEQRFAGLRVMNRARDGTLFRVVAEPATVVALSRHGFWSPERVGTTFYRWLTSQEARVELRGRCEPCIGTLRFEAASFAQTRTLTIRQGDRVLSRRRIGTSSTAVSVFVVFRRRTELTLSTDPGPQSIQETTGMVDDRDVSIQITVPLRFQPAG